jgi:hypothetical protein
LALDDLLYIRFKVNPYMFTKNEMYIFEVFLVNPAGINVRICQVFYYNLRILGSLLSAKEIENNIELQIE